MALEEKSETPKFDERPKGVGRGKSRRAGRERKVDIGGKQGATRGVGVRVPRVMGGGGSRFRKGGGGWWQSRAGENAVCKAGGEFKRSCAERMASPRATFPRFFSLGLVLARTRATTSLDATSRAPTRRYHQRGKEKHTEGATDTETDSKAKREGSSGGRRRGKATRTESSADKDGESDRSLAPSHVSSPVLSHLSPRGTRARSETTFSCQQNSRCGPYDLRRTVRPPGHGTRASILSANASIISPGSVATCPLDGPPRRNNHV